MYQILIHLFTQFLAFELYSHKEEAPIIKWMSHVNFLLDQTFIFVGLQSIDESPTTLKITPIKLFRFCPWSLPPLSNISCHFQDYNFHNNITNNPSWFTDFHLNFVSQMLNTN